MMDIDGNTKTVNLYENVLNTLIQNNKKDDGSDPVWINAMKLVFEYGKKISKIIIKVEEGVITSASDLLTN